jgi:hypothetical protein
MKIVHGVCVALRCDKKSISPTYKRHDRGQFKGQLDEKILIDANNFSV